MARPCQQYFIYQVLRALKFIHSAKILHRDLKPGAPRCRPVGGGGSKFHHPRVSSESQNRGPPPGCNVVTFSGNPSEGRGILRRLGGACCYFPSTLFRREPASQRQLRPADLRFWTGPRCAAFFFQSQEYRPLIDVDQIPNCTPLLFFLLLFFRRLLPPNLLFQHPIFCLRGLPPAGTILFCRLNTLEFVCW